MLCQKTHHSWIFIFYRSEPEATEPEDAENLQSIAALEAMIGSIISETEETDDNGIVGTTTVSSTAICKAGTRNCGTRLLGCPSTSLQMTPIIAVTEDAARSATTQPSAQINRQRASRSCLTTLALRSIFIQEPVVDATIEQNLLCMNANGSPESIIRWGEMTKLDNDGQQRAFEVICSTFVLSYFEDPDDSETEHLTPDRLSEICLKLHKLAGTENSPGHLLRLFLTGAAGSGKSAVINSVKAYAARFTAMLGLPFTRYTIRLSALTGAAATEIGGETLHSVAHLMGNHTINMEDISKWKNTRILIIDEISFINYEDLRKLDRNMRSLTEDQTKPHGNVHIVFSGDFSQLEPIASKPLYAVSAAPLWNSVMNSYIEMHGRHRFRDDSDWGEILQRIREGTMTNEDREKINARVVEE
jgi:hypothetical protein